MKTKVLSIAILSLIFFFTFSSAVASDLASQPLTVTISMNYETLHPLLKRSGITSFTQGFALQPLTVLSTSQKWEPLLTENIPSFENGQAKWVEKNGKKNIQATWKLKNKLSWGDGTPLTCADLEFSRRVALSKNLSVGELSSYKQIAKISWDEKNPKNCTFDYAESTWAFNRLTSFFALPKHLEEKIFNEHEKTPEAYERHSLYLTQPTNPGLYYGAYVVKEQKLGSHLVFEKNPYFYGPHPKENTVIVKVLAEPAIEAAVATGAVDLIADSGISVFKAIAVESLIKKENLAYVVDFKPSFMYEHIDFNMDHPILAERKVRQALAHATNKEEMNKSLFEGKMRVTHHNICHGDPHFTEDPSVVKKYEFSKRKANSLLDEAGWKKSRDGFRYKDGKKLSFTMLAAAGAPQRTMLMGYLQGQWKDIGVDLVLKTEDARNLFGEIWRKRKFDSMMFTWGTLPEVQPARSWHSSEIPSEANNWDGENSLGYKNAKVDALVEQFEKEFSMKKRTKIAHQFLKEFTADIPSIILYDRPQAVVKSSRVKGFELSGNGTAESYFAYNWEKQKGELK